MNIAQFANLSVAFAIIVSHAAIHSSGSNVVFADDISTQDMLELMTTNDKQLDNVLIKIAYTDLTKSPPLKRTVPFTAPKRRSTLQSDLAETSKPNTQEGDRESVTSEPEVLAIQGFFDKRSAPHRKRDLSDESKLREV